MLVGELVAEVVEAVLVGAVLGGKGRMKELVALFSSLFIYLFIYLFLSSLPSWTSWPINLDIGRRPLHISFPCSSGKVHLCKIPYLADYYRN